MSIPTDWKHGSPSSLVSPTTFKSPRQHLNTDQTQRFVLAEMVKYSHIDVNTLVDFIKYHEVQPDWMSFHLPRGRLPPYVLLSRQNIPKIWREERHEITDIWESQVVI